MIGPVSVGAVPNTAAPVPVSSVRAEAKFAEDGVPRNVATPVPSPLTPAEMLGCAQVKFPFAAMVVAKLFAEQSDGFAAKAVAVATFPAVVARVPVVGRVTFVEPVVVRVRLFAPEVMKSAAVVIFPLIESVRAASPVVIVKVRSAVRLLPGVIFK